MSCFRGRVEREQRRRSKAIDEQLKRDRAVYRKTLKLLVLGASKSGKTAIVHYIRIGQEGYGYTDAECLAKVPDVHSRIREIILTVVRAMPELEPPVEVADPQNKGRVKYLLEIVAKPDFNDYSPEFFTAVSELWKDEGVRACYSRSSRCQLIDNAQYFMDAHKLEQVSSQEYKPSVQDLLCCHLTTPFTETKLTIGGDHFHFIDTHWSDRRIRCRVFGECTAVVYVVDCGNFNVQEYDEINLLQESLDLFKNFWTSYWLRDFCAILFLNKQDILKKKIDSGVTKLEDHFPEFETYNLPEKTTPLPGESLLYTRAKFFIRDMFLRVTMETPDKRRFCYPHFTTAIDTDIDNAARVQYTLLDMKARLHLIKYELL